jgi:tetratricopeptide (TPR) repeat protein
MTTQGGQKVKVFPTKNVKITVDKEACLKYGIVPPYFKDKIVDSICWTIKKNYLTKNDIMNLDIIATNKWKRPIYYTAIASVKDYFDVDKYCMVEGWVYKFMPVKADPQDYYPSIAGIDALNSYDIFMHKTVWGNVNDPHVYIDPETRNNAFRPKLNMLRIAQSLIRMGEKKKALDIVDLFFKNFPLEKFSADMDIVYFADLYYKTEQIEKANKLLERLSKIYTEDVEYYYSFSGNFADAYKDDIQTDLEMIHGLQVLASRNNQNKLAKQLDDLFNREEGKFKQ